MHDNATEEIRSRINIEDLASEYLDLKRAGRNFKALSPWTNERTPSLIISSDKQIWHDFSSGKGGDIFSFIMEVEGLTFRESLELLARKSGVELQQFDNKKAEYINKKKKIYYEILSLSSNFFQYCLSKDKEALQYAKNRGLTREIIQEFKIGYAPRHGKILVDFLIKRGFSLQDIKSAGLTNRFDGDIFRDRLTISLQDISGAPVGFTGRLIRDIQNAPKYLNTPQTLLYDKSSNVFGLFQAKNEIRKSGFIVVVEGNMDVISSHQAGVKNVVATAGTAITSKHLKTLSRFSGDIRLCFDSDDAGIKATERAISLAQETGIDLSIITLNQGKERVKDPDELIQKSAELWTKAINSPKPAIEWILDQYEKRLNIAEATGKKKFSTIALKLLGKINDPVEKEFYLKDIAKRIGISKESLLAKHKDDNSPTIIRKKKTKIQKVEPINDSFIYEDDLLALILADRNLIRYLKPIKPTYLHGEERQNILNAILNSDEDMLQKNDNYVKILLLKAEERLGVIKSSSQAEIERLVQKVKIENLQKQKQNLLSRLEDIEIENDDKEKTVILNQIIKLNKELNRGKK